VPNISAGDIVRLEDNKWLNVVFLFLIVFKHCLDVGAYGSVHRVLSGCVLEITV
jgi:hypothetical protein